jgi:hypothetical protein
MDFKMVVFEVRTVERVMRNYIVAIPVAPKGEPEEDLRAQAEMEVRVGNQSKFTEGDAEIEEVLSVERRRD